MQVLSFNPVFARNIVKAALIEFTSHYLCHNYRMHTFTTKVLNALNDFNMLCKDYSIEITDEVYVYLDYYTAVKRRNVSGGTGPISVKNQLDELKNWLEK